MKDWSYVHFAVYWVSFFLVGIVAREWFGWSGMLVWPAVIGVATAFVLALGNKPSGLKVATPPKDSGHESNP